MRKVITTLAACALAASLALVGPLSAAPGNKYPNDVPRSHDCKDASGRKVGEIELTAPEKMWPPNHKYQPATFLATAELETDDVTLETAGTHDEIVDGEEMDGAGNTDLDVNPAAAADGPHAGSATTSHEVRAERSGQGDGRTYTMSYVVTFGTTECDGEFPIAVPHDMRGGRGW